MQKIMIQSYINNIKKKINDENKQIKQKIINLNIKNFINEYNTVLNSNKFINYLINILGRNLKLFFNVQKNITNRSLNLILYSNIIKNIKNYINKCNNDIRNLIEDISNGNSEDFIEKQVNLEKLKKTSIKLQNKRTLNGFKKTEKIFLKKNFYYICQKYIIEEIIKFCQNDHCYYDEYIKQIDSLIEGLIKKMKILTKRLKICFMKNYKI